MIIEKLQHGWKSRDISWILNSLDFGKRKDHNIPNSIPSVIFQYSRLTKELYRSQRPRQKGLPYYLPLQYQVNFNDK